MKAFISGVIAALIVAAGAAVILQTVNKPVDMAFSTDSARVSPEREFGHRN
ncbi:hypothetical protein [Ferrovibrio sp.]|uniref:hypothetical protein n=1 Tax=Ferrovibrio sp. TaxID=1917215 RepID=UPI00260A2DB3|nr:hypothetical protein [Ferrovibrio sp.]